MMREPAAILPTSVERLAGLLARRPACVALTGAGLSTRSGLPDFRSPGSGLWELAERLPDDQARLMTLQGFKEAPEAFYDRFRPFLAAVLSAAPNPAHGALAQLEAAGYLQGVITQNGDGLHQKAGSQTVVEIHGSLATATCLRCHQSDTGPPLWQAFCAQGEIPRCRHCGGLMKPDIILTGEQLPWQAALKARTLLRESALVLIAGTSLPGGPVLAWLEAACDRGARLAIINLGPTLLDSAAEVVVRADVVEALPAIAQQLRSS